MFSPKRSLALATLMLAAPSFAAPALASTVPADVARAVEDFNRAQFANDTTTLSRLVADDYLLVNSDSSLQDKDSFLADFRRPGFKLDPYVFEEPVQKMLGDAAVVGGLIHLSWTQDGKHQERKLRLVQVWTKRDGRWQVTYTQLTRVPD